MPAVGPQDMRSDAEYFGDPPLDGGRLQRSRENRRNSRGVITPGDRKRGQRAVLLAKSGLYVLNVPSVLFHEAPSERKLLTTFRHNQQFSPLRQHEKQFPPDWEPLRVRKSGNLNIYRGVELVGTEEEEEDAQFPPDCQQFPPDDVLSTFAGRLRLARKKAGFKSARALSEAVEVSDSNIRLYEKGEQEPKMSVLSRLAAACHVSVDWLANGEGPMEYLPVGAVTAEGHTVEIGEPIRLKVDTRQPGAIAIAEGELDPELPDDFIEKFNPDRLASALKLAEELFAAENRRPTDRQRIQTMVLIYNHLTNQVVEAQRKQSESFHKETESK